MKLNTVRAGHAGSIRAFARTLVVGGPVGLFHALRLAYLRHRIAEVRTLLERENQLHRSHTAALCAELNGLIDSQQRTNAAAGEFWRHCSGGGEAQS